jgi:hypothetical protein
MVMIHTQNIQLYGGALKCAWCGADLPRDAEFQRYHMLKVHRLEC